MAKATKKPVKKGAAKSKTTPKSAPKKSPAKKSRGKNPAQSLQGTDIINLLLADHKPLKQLLNILKNTDKPLSERKRAFEQFAPLLDIHAHSEEQALYKVMEHDSALRQDSFEGEVEHSLADEMVAATRAEHDKDMWSAKAKVLAELVAHHLEEEEEKIFPEVRKEISLEKRQKMGANYLEFKKVEASGSGELPELEDDETPMEDDDEDATNNPSH